VSVHIQMIGTGSAFAKRYFNNNGLISSGGYHLLIDCGITAPYALHQLQIGLDDIDGILITHIHGDHVGGLEEVAYRMKFVHQSKLTLFVPASIAQDLWEHTLKGGLEDTSGHCDSLDCYFNVQLLDEQSPYQINENFTVELIRTQHIPGKPSYGVLINDSVFYSSDMTFAPQLLTDLVSQGRCKHIMHDCQLSGQGVVHTTLQELLTLPVTLQERIWLMHYGDDKDRYEGQTGFMRFIEQHKIYTFD